MTKIRGNAASVSFEHVVKTYPGVSTPAVDDVSFAIEAAKLAAGEPGGIGRFQSCMDRGAFGRIVIVPVVEIDHATHTCGDM